MAGSGSLPLHRLETERRRHAAGILKKIASSLQFASHFINRDDIGH
jgi:hypothetical protein